MEPGSSPNNILIETTDGTRYIGRCLPCGARRRFLEYRTQAWEILAASQPAQVLAQSSLNNSIAYLWDNDGDFQFLCIQMLDLHKLPWKTLDLAQVVTLLFRTEDSDGLLVKLQFPPMPTNGKPGKVTNEDPYTYLVAMMAFGEKGDWYQAKQTVDEMPYDDVVKVAAHLEEMYTKATKGDKDKPTAPPVPEITPDRKAILDSIKAKAREMTTVDENQAALDAIQAAMQNKLKENPDV